METITTPGTVTKGLRPVVGCGGDDAPAVVLPSGDLSGADQVVVQRPSALSSLSPLSRSGYLPSPAGMEWS